MATPKKPVLVFSDTHAPFVKSGALQFLVDTYKKEGCGSIVCAGDLCDFHSMSRHITELDSPSPENEYNKMLEFTGDLCRAFPKGTLVLGNHDFIPQRQMKEIGLAHSLLKEHNDLYGLSKGWKVKQLYHTIFDDRVLIEHGIGSGGMNGAINTALAKRSSYVQGHTHSYANVTYRANYQDTIFGMNCGCLFDEGSLAARYGGYNKFKGVLGCGVVYGPSKAQFIPM